MKFTFDYEETLCRRVHVDADNLGEAIKEMHRLIDSCELVLGGDDFLAGKISLPLGENSPYYVRVEVCGEPVKNAEDIDIVIEEW